jgi:hypothetical protein
MVYIVLEGKNNMRNPVITVLTIFVLIVACAIVISCTVTKTVTVNKTFTATQQPVTTVQPKAVTLTVTIRNTITTTMEGAVTTVTLEPVVYTPIFERAAPEIPHRYVIDMPHTGLSMYECEGDSVCFVCHPMPIEHNKWLYDSEICEDCHKVSDNPYLTPDTGYRADYP